MLTHQCCIWVWSCTSKTLHCSQKTGASAPVFFSQSAACAALASVVYLTLN